jgi:hypothetical protein
MTKLTADDDIVVWDEQGVHSIGIGKGQVVDVPLLLVSAAVRQGAYEPGKNGGTVAVAAFDGEPSEKVKAIAQAYRTILQTGDVTKLDEAGIPRVNELEAIVGRTNKADRDAAWVIVEG